MKQTTSQIAKRFFATLPMQGTDKSTPAGNAIINAWLTSAPTDRAASVRQARLRSEFGIRCVGANWVAPDNWRWFF